MHNESKKTVEAYFAAVTDLRSGEMGALNNMMSLWKDDGVLNVLAGTGDDGWPRSKVYEGADAILARFKAMVNPERVKLTDVGKDVGINVKSVVGEVRESGKTVTATVMIIVSTDEDNPRSIHIEENKFAFTFDGGKIQKVIEDVSWSGATVSQKIMSPFVDTKSLSIQDIGRLTLAAWAIA